MKYICLCFALHSVVSLFGQHQQTDTLMAPAVYENIAAKKLFADSLSNSVVIFIKKEVKLHRHDHHSEHVVVLAGEADMQLGDKWFRIKTGDCIFIPKGTAHKVLVRSAIPLKVLSIQSPFFDGSDRVMME